MESSKKTASEIYSLSEEELDSLLEDAPEIRLPMKKLAALFVCQARGELQSKSERVLTELINLEDILRVQTSIRTKRILRHPLVETVRELEEKCQRLESQCREFEDMPGGTTTTRIGKLSPETMIINRPLLKIRGNLSLVTNEAKIKLGAPKHSFKKLLAGSLSSEKKTEKRILEKKSETEKPEIQKLEPRKLESQKQSTKKTNPIPLKRKSEEEDVDSLDIFDFEKYSTVFTIFSQFYDGIELYLRTAIYVDYLYNYNLAERERGVSLEEVQERGKEFIDQFTDAFVTEDLLRKWFFHFAPEKVDNVDKVLTKYIFCESELFNRLYKKYVDPNWTTVKLWFYDPRGESRMTK